MFCENLSVIEVPLCGPTFAKLGAPSPRLPLTCRAPPAPRRRRELPPCPNSLPPPAETRHSPPTAIVSSVQLRSRSEPHLKKVRHRQRRRQRTSNGIVRCTVLVRYSAIGSWSQVMPPSSEVLTASSARRARLQLQRKELHQDTSHTLFTPSQT